MFNILDHLMGAILVRINRKILFLNNKPDISNIQDKLMVGGHCNIRSLSENGIESILDMREENEDNLGELKKFEIDYLRLKVKDRTAPSRNDVLKGIEWIGQKINEKKNIFVHCNLGRGRGPLMICLYLIYRGMPVEKAIKLVKKSRKYTYFNSSQLKFLWQFSSEIN